MILTRGILRIIFLACIGWIAVECVLFYLLAGTIGFLPATMVMVVKGIGGFLLLGANLRAILGKVGLHDLRNGLAAISDASFAALGAFLIMLPGCLTTLAGLALFSPSIRMALVRRMNREKRHADRDGVISLDASEWSEISKVGEEQPAKPRKRTPRRRD